jgi:DNA-binding NtrC family response regulator
MKNFKVLLVDDEQEFIETLSERLKMRDLDTKLALDGEQALEAVEDDEPDVMLLDLKMPGIDGMEVLRKVKKAYPGVQVVMLTGHGTDKDEEQARRLGAYAYLQKPVDLEHLVVTLRDAFKNKIARKVESSMMAATFAEAGDVKTAREIMDKEDDPLGQRKGRKAGKK